jgi:hypothetical protein
MAGMIHLGPRLNLSGRRKGRPMATISVMAIGHRFSPSTSAIKASIIKSYVPDPEEVRVRVLFARQQVVRWPDVVPLTGQNLPAVASRLTDPERCHTDKRTPSSIRQSTAHQSIQLPCW